MVLQVLEVAIRPPFRWSIFRPTVTAKFSGGGEQRASLLSRALRRYTIPMLPEEQDRKNAIAFFDARGWSLESFLWKDPLDYERWSVELTQVTGNTYKLPTTGPYGGDYPIDNSSMVAYDGPSVAAVSSVDTDARTIDLTSPPGGLVTLDYHYYRRVRLEPGSWTWEVPAPVVQHDFVLVEVTSG